MGYLLEFRGQKRVSATATECINFRQSNVYRCVKIAGKCGKQMQRKKSRKSEEQRKEELRN
jgi:hypothetical protein